MAGPTVPAVSTRPTPERIFTVLTAYEQSAALKTGIDLDVFTAIGEGANTAASLAKKVGAAERGIRILCDYLTIHGFLTKELNCYALTPESAVFLNRRSSECLASMADFLTDPGNKHDFEALSEAVRKGGTTRASGDYKKPSDELWVKFARVMTPLSTPTADFIAELVGTAEGQPCRVLDVAAGHGMYGITIAKRNPNALIVALDWPRVLEVAQENARKYGILDRYETKPGSAFEIDFGSGYDLVLLTNIFHHFDIGTCETLARRARSALKFGGKAITLDFVPNEDRISPPAAAAFSLAMLAGTHAGDVYTFSQYEQMFANAGFQSTTLHSIPGTPQRVLVSET